MCRDAPLAFRSSDHDRCLSTDKRLGYLYRRYPMSRRGRSGSGSVDDVGSSSTRSDGLVLVLSEPPPVVATRFTSGMPAGHHWIGENLPGCAGGREYTEQVQYFCTPILGALGRLVG